jgi:hypothetical protein
MFAKFASRGVHDEELGWLDACKDFVEAADNECGFPSWNWIERLLIWHSHWRSDEHDGTIKY